MRDETHEVRLLPLPPEGRLRPRHAVVWLRDIAPSYAGLVAEGFLAGYEGARADFYFLARDLGVMIEAASEALAQDRDVPVERERAASEDPTGPLARIVALPSTRWDEVSGDVLGAAHEELREELLRRCEAAQSSPGNPREEPPPIG